MGCSHANQENAPVTPAIPANITGPQQQKKGATADKTLTLINMLFFIAWLKDFGYLYFPRTVKITILFILYKAFDCGLSGI